MLVLIGYRNKNVSLILHSKEQHEKWNCSGCTPVFEYRTLEGDDRYDRYYNQNNPEAFLRCKASGGCGPYIYSCAGFCLDEEYDD